MWSLNHFPQPEEVSELWLLLTFLGEGFVRQSDLLQPQSVEVLLVVLDFKTKKTHWFHLAESVQTSHDFNVSSLMALWS